MDDIVKQAMAKWPNVPDCYGWLGLDSRGQWHMRDDRVQLAGAFQSGLPDAKGSVLRHEKLIGFINRNYGVDAAGQWFFQNGPQKVFVELELAPYVWRIDQDYAVQAHTGEETEATACLMDEGGRVYLQTPMGLGLVHTLDVGRVAEALEQDHWQLAKCHSKDLPQQHGYVISPQTRAQEDARPSPQRP
jgi:hypothetical protein